MDITYSSLRRISKGKSPFVADAEHIHHKLLHAGFSQKKTVVILTSVAIIAGALASLLMGENTIKTLFYIYTGNSNYHVVTKLHQGIDKKK